MKTIAQQLQDRAAEYRRWDRTCRVIDAATKLCVAATVLVVMLHVAPQAIRSAMQTAALTAEQGAR